MKRKILLTTLMLAVFMLVFAVVAAADALVNYCDVEITLVSGETVTGYCKVDSGSKRFLRDEVYTEPDTSSEKIDWGTIKIFDASNATVYGTVTPTEVAGTACSSKAVNTTEFYFPPTTTKILNTSFTSGWKSLKKVWIPNDTTVIDYNAFTGSPVSEIVLEEGTVITSIGNDAFKECANLQSFPFMEGMQSLGRNCFYLSGLSGKVVIPNSMTYLGPGSLLSTKIETLVLGDGAVEIGYNFIGTFNSTTNAYLKEIYMPAEVTFDNGGSKFFKCANQVNFYIVGTESECASAVNALKAQTGGYYLKFVTADELSDTVGGAGYGVIYTGYNRCGAFYGDNHNVQDAEFNFTSYTEKMTYTAECERCKKCTTTAELDPIVEFLGYSARMNGNSICAGYTINAESLAAYESETESTLKLGVVAIIPINEAELKPIYVENGEIKNIDYSVAVAIESAYAGFDFRINGITSSDYETELVMCAYAYDGSAVSYLCVGENGYGQYESASTVTFNSKATEGGELIK